MDFLLFDGVLTFFRPIFQKLRHGGVLYLGVGLDPNHHLVLFRAHPSWGLRPLHDHLLMGRSIRNQFV